MIKLTFVLILITSLVIDQIHAYKSLYSGYDSNDDDLDEYALDIAVKLKKEFSDDLVSSLFATSYGLERIARIPELDIENTLFHFKFTNSDLNDEDQMRPFEALKTHRSKRYIHNKIDSIREDDRVDFVLPQVYLNRHKRAIDKFSSDEIETILEELLFEENLRKKDTRKYHEMDNSVLSSIEKRIDSLSIPIEKKEFENLNINKTETSENGFVKLPEEINFNDANYGQQWYLINDGQLKIPPSHDLNVKEAWVKGYTGKNVTIVIIDDGLDHEHPDFEGKYRADLSYDYNDEDDVEHDPMPSTFDNQNNHGTRCAGAAAANANNSVCGVGVAYDAQIAGIRILDGPITDLLEARALSYKAQEVDIRSASWGPKDDGAHMEYPGPFVNLALEYGVKHGRKGKGTLYVWASGNGGGNDDDCGCDGYVSHWNIISIGSVNHHGLNPYFMELCPSTMAVVYSGGQSKVGGDEDDPGVRVVASDVRGKCTTTFQGTSSAAPLAAGALALVLEANPDLTYRDVMHLIARTSRIPNVEDTSGWIVNGAKYHVNEKYGFGVLDVSQMLQEAQNWENVPVRQKCEIEYTEEFPEIGPNDKVTLSINTESCTDIDLLEHVVANISFSFSKRGDLKLTLISPHGTPSEVMSYRKNDKSKKGAKHFPFMTLFNWGESPQGEWKLVIESRTREDSDTPNTGRLEHFSLVFYGSRNRKYETKMKKRLLNRNARAYVPSDEDVRKIYKTELKVSKQTRIIHKRVLEGSPELRDFGN